MFVKLNPTFALWLIVNSVFLEANSEKHYQAIFAKKMEGKEEVLLPDKTRCDVVTETHAVEVEFARKWTEGLGQSLWYSFQLNKKPGVVLIIEDEKDRRFLVRLKSLLKHRKLDDVQIWTITQEGSITQEKAN